MSGDPMTQSTDLGWTKNDQPQGQGQAARDASGARVGRYTLHLCLDVRGALRRPNSTLRGFLHEDGRRMTPAEAREALMDALAEGKRVLPVGECEGFDYQTGCPGHPVADVEAAQTDTISAASHDVDRSWSTPDALTTPRAALHTGDA